MFVLFIPRLETMSDFKSVKTTPLSVLDFSKEEKNLDVLIKLNKNFLEKIQSKWHKLDISSRKQEGNTKRDTNMEGKREEKSREKEQIAMFVFFLFVYQIMAQEEWCHRGQKANMVLVGQQVYTAVGCNKLGNHRTGKNNLRWEGRKYPHLKPQGFSEVGFTRAEIFAGSDGWWHDMLVQHVLKVPGWKIWIESSSESSSTNRIKEWIFAESRVIGSLTRRGYCKNGSSSIIFGWSEVEESRERDQYWRKWEITESLPTSAKWEQQVLCFILVMRDDNNIDGFRF